MSTGEMEGRIVEIVRRHMPPGRKFRVFLFGSRARGDANARSDFDVGVDAGEKIPFEAFLAIQREIQDLPMLQKADFVDFQAADEGFCAVAGAHTRTLYEE